MNTTETETTHPLVYPCDFTDMKNGEEEPIGRAESTSKAARMINKFIEGRDGDWPGLKHNDIGYNAERNCYYIFS